MAPYPTADRLERITGGLPLSVETYFRLVEDGVLGADDRVPEYWIVDLDARRIEVRTDPARRAYGSLTVASPGDRLRPRLVPDVEIDVAALLR